MVGKWTPEWEPFVFILTSPLLLPIFTQEVPGFIFDSCLVFPSLMPWLDVRTQTLCIAISGGESHDHDQCVETESRKLWVCVRCTGEDGYRLVQ